MLKNTFIELLLNYTDNNKLTIEFWTEVEENYTHKKRHYHSLQHLEHIFAQLSEVKIDIKNWNSILFTMFYHDIVYNALKSDNEEKSAEFAEARLKLISASANEIELCKNQILATKSHSKSDDSDTNYFIDTDLSILGTDWEAYSLYCRNVRKEYSIYPDFVYNPGRKKVLHHFLSMDRIYKTDYFHRKFETQAKRNLTNELNLL